MTEAPPAADAPYTVRSIQQMLGISRGVIDGLIGAGFVSPSRGPRNEHRFSFQDVVLLRTAYGLQTARIPPRRILRSLQRLKATLPDALPLTGLRITAIGDRVAVRDGRDQWEADSGQYVMDFEVASAAPGTLAFLPAATRAADPASAATPSAADRSAAERLTADRDTADDWFARGETLEAGDGAAAEAAYRRALNVSPGHADAALNLGALLCDAGRCQEAVDVFDAALAHRPASPLMLFNLAIALEELGQPQAALARYERCLELDPTLADAHFNAARLHEQLGHAQRALRHFSAYRRLQP